MPPPGRPTSRPGGGQACNPGPVRVLVTNDDGVTSPGLRSLARTAAAMPAEVMVVAPKSDQSGSGAAIGPLERRLDGLGRRMSPAVVAPVH